MSAVTVTLHDGALGAGRFTPVRDAGAVVVFEGVVREMEQGRKLRALRYEAYEPMTCDELRKLAEAMLAEHQVMAIDVEHSVGEVAIHETSFRLRVCAKHRKAALMAVDQFIDRMKRDVPLWKTPCWAEETQYG